MIRVVLVLGALLLGCNSGPTFKGIESIKVQKVGAGGLVTIPLTATAERRAIDCLYQVSEVSQQASEREALLQEVYLIEVRDAAGIRSFELYTGRHLKGNKGKYYQTNCLGGIIGL